MNWAFFLFRFHAYRVHKLRESDIIDNRRVKQFKEEKTAEVRSLMTLALGEGTAFFVGCIPKLTALTILSNDYSTQYRYCITNISGTVNTVNIVSTSRHAVIIRAYQPGNNKKNFPFYTGMRFHTGRACSHIPVFLSYFFSPFFFIKTKRPIYGMVC